MKANIDTPTRTKRGQLSDPAPRYGDFHTISRDYNIRRSLAYSLLDVMGGPVASVLIKKPGAARGKRLISLASLDAYLAGLEGAK